MKGRIIKVADPKSLMEMHPVLGAVFPLQPRQRGISA